MLASAVLLHHISVNPDGARHRLGHASRCTRRTEAGWQMSRYGSSLAESQREASEAREENDFDVTT
jgi:hypothetical protein